MQPSRRRLLHWALRILVSAAVLAIIFHVVPFREVWDAARRLPPWLWLSGFAMFLIGHMITAAKWWMLIGADIRFGQAFRAHLAGLGANLALPGVAGGDVVRAGLVLSASGDKGRLAIGSLADRLIDTISLGLVALGGAWFAFQPDGQTAMLTAAGVAVALVLAVLMLRYLAAPLGGLATRIAGDGKVGRLLARAMAILADLGRQPGLLLACLLLSLLVQSLFVAINIAFALALGMTIPAAAWFYAWAAAKIIAILPISLGGLGVREASMAALLSPFGASYGAVIAVGLIWQTVLYASGIVGIAIQSGFSAVARPAGSPRPDPQPHIGQI
ncbi:MAG TPA: lysylphosphatidylglycerol synthase transmembrane domain-containing protein [Sphingobium sp.]|jgi:uncharacterized protein (TIRG00374 family)|nr:lysylphosphatidylglycerol synthase transmembrane domain-containing protein [Sphingobium sp.]